MPVTYHRHPDAPPLKPRDRTPRDGIEYMPSSNYPETRSHDEPPFPNDLTAFPQAMTDIHAHVLVNDLIRHDMSIVKVASDWHMTHAQIEKFIGLPIVQRELNAVRHIAAIRAALAKDLNAESSIRALGRIVELPLLDPEDDGYTIHAANARANLIRLAATRALSERRRPTSTPTSTPTSSPTSGPASSGSSPGGTAPGGTAVGGQSGVSSDSSPDSPSDTPPDSPSDPTPDSSASQTASVSERTSSDAAPESVTAASESTRDTRTCSPTETVPGLTAPPPCSSVALRGESSSSSDSPPPHDHSPLTSSPCLCDSVVSPSPARPSDSSAHAAFSSSSLPLPMAHSPLPSSTRSSALSADSAVPLFTPTSRARDHPAA